MSAEEFIFRVDDYTDPVSKNECEVFSVWHVTETFNVIVKRKVWERDYGSQTMSMHEYIQEFYEKHSMRNPTKKTGMWTSNQTYYTNENNRGYD